MSESAWYLKGSESKKLDDDDDEGELCANVKRVFYSILYILGVLYTILLDDYFVMVRWMSAL